MYNSRYTRGKFPTLANLNSQRLQASNVYSELRQSRDFFAILNKISKEARVAGIITTRKTAVTAYNWNLMSDTLADTAEHTARLSKVINLIIKYHTDLLYGSILFKINWTFDSAGNYAVPNLTHYELTDYEKINSNSFYTYDDTSNKIRHDLQPNQQEWLYFTDDNVELGGVIDTIADQIIFMHEIIGKWNRLNNRMQGIIMGTIDGDAVYRSGSKLGQSAEDIKKISDDLQATLENIGNDPTNVLKTLTGIDIKLSSIVESSAANSYALYKSTLEDDIAIAVLGQANTTELPNSGGSRAALQVLNSIRQDILFNDVNNITELIGNFLAIEWQASTGTSNVPYKFAFDIDDFEDYESNAQTLNYLGSAGLPIPIKKSELYQKIGFSVPNENDDTINIGQTTSNV